jgi:hypothetical protein
VIVILARLAVEAAAEVGEPLLVPRVGDDPFDPGERGPQAGDLAFGLPPRPDQPERASPRPRQVARGHGARRTRAELPEPVGLHERQELGSVGGEQRDDEARALGEACVGLQPRDAELEVGRCHDVQEALVEAEPEPRAALDRAAREAAEAPIHRLDGVRRGQKRLDVGFAKVERHGAG